MSTACGYCRAAGTAGPHCSRTPAPGAPLFQAASANFNPWTDVKVNSKSADRGPLLIISGEKDHTVPWAISNATFKKQQRNVGVTEIVRMPNRGHALTIDGGWQEVARTALDFVRRFARPVLAEHVWIRG